ncbi:MAG TPA: hypothetical protein VM939_14535 [Gemmatimonadaceae bacterium]|nr:hypothetical protein [Gemmatimonadaceae bacterium]
MRINQSCIAAIIIAASVTGIPETAQAQRIDDTRVTEGASLGASNPQGSTAPVSDMTAFQSHRPRWVKAAVIGGVSGGLLFAALHSLLGDWAENSMAHDVAIGAIGGGVILGGSIALYDVVCSDDSRSRELGLCGRYIPRRLTARSSNARSMDSSAK